MTDKATNNILKIEHIKEDLMFGRISYDQAKILAEPTIRDINERAIEIARKHGMRPRKVSFEVLVR